MIWIECEYCGTAYCAERNSRKYCSDSCKTMANRQRRRDEEMAITRIKIQRTVIKYIDQEIEDMRKRHQQSEEENAKQQEIQMLENQQREIEKQKQLEIERQEKVEKDRLAKEAKIADEKLKKAAREAENIKKAQLAELFTPIIINGTLSVLNQVFGSKSKENSQERWNVSTTPSNESTPKAD
jgi:predicted nucleic acid-binding Zn ribbon protein